MTISRREFLAGAGSLAAAAAIPGSLLAALEAKSRSTPATSRWSDVRSLFALRRDVMHFASFFIASHPQPVRDAIDDYRRAIDANPFLTVERGLFESEAENMQRKVREETATYLGAQPDEIALTGNTTTGLALVYHGLPLRRHDDILTTTHDHYSHHESIRFAAERAGATVRRIALFRRSGDATADEITGRLRSEIRPETRVVGVTWVHSSTGVRLPIRRIAEVIGEVNRRRRERDRVRLIVDGVHGIGAVDETIAAMGCDYFVAGTHKWMFGPRGTGIIWARPEAWARLRPTIPSFSSLAAYEAWMKGQKPPGPNDASRVTPGGFIAYEHQWAMGAAFRLHGQIGRARVAERIRALNDQLKAGLDGIRQVTLHTPRNPALAAGITCFEVSGQEPAAVVKRLLDRNIIASTSPYRVSYVRLAPGLVNDEAEVDAALRAVRALTGE